MSEVQVLSAFSEDQTERLTGVSRSQLRYWDRTDFFSPSLAYADRSVKHSRLYSFRDLVCLKILNALRNEAKVSLHHLRDVKDQLLHLGDDLWATTTLYLLGKRVVVVNPETEQLEDAASQQLVLQIPLKVVSQNMEDAIDRLNDRSAQSPEISRSVAIAGNQYVVKGTRIPVASIKEFSNAGYSVDQILEQYPSLSETEVRAAIEFDPAA